MLHLGGCSDKSGAQRLECIAVGHPLTQAFDAEHQAVAGDIICHGDTFRMVQKFFESEEMNDGAFFKVKGLNEDERMLSKKNHRNDDDDDEGSESQMWRYVPLVVAPFLEPGMDSGDWGSDSAGGATSAAAVRAPGGGVLATSMGASFCCKTPLYTT